MSCWKVLRHGRRHGQLIVPAVPRRLLLQRPCNINAKALPAQQPLSQKHNHPPALPRWLGMRNARGGPALQRDAVLPAKLQQR